MGYFHTGFVFTHQPNWERLNEFPTRYGFRGYQHKNRAVWLLDYWERPRLWQRLRKHTRHRFTGIDCAGDRFTTNTRALPSETQAVLAGLDQVVKVLRGYHETYGPGWVRLALAVSSRLACPVFFFAADDELYDMACRVRSERIDALACRYGRFVFRHHGGRTSITPLQFEDEEEQNAPPSLLEKMQGVERVELLEPMVVEGGDKLYQFPVELWPAEAGEPAETLGIGTWDPLQNLDRDFTIVFVRESGALPAE